MLTDLNIQDFIVSAPEIQIWQIIKSKIHEVCVYETYKPTSATVPNMLLHDITSGPDKIHLYIVQII